MKNKIQYEEREGKSPYAYDIFISYCSEDRFWVHDMLMKKLEGTYGFKLCLHLRDFLLGEQIDNEIVRNMELSKSMYLLSVTILSPKCGQTLNLDMR